MLSNFLAADRTGAAELSWLDLNIFENITGMQSCAVETPKRRTPKPVQTDSADRIENSTPFSPGAGNWSPLHQTNNGRKLVQSEQSEFQAGLDRNSVFSPAPRFLPKESSANTKRKRESASETEVRVQSVVTYGKRGHQQKFENVVPTLPPSTSCDGKQPSKSLLKRRLNQTSNIPTHQTQPPNDSSPSTSTVRASHLAANKKPKPDVPMSPSLSSSSSSSSSNGNNHDNPQSSSSSSMTTTTTQDDCFTDPYYFIYHLPPYDELDRPLPLVQLLPVLPTTDDDDDDGVENTSIMPFNHPSSSSLGNNGGKLSPLTLILDLDETLIHCSSVELANFDFAFPLTVETRSNSFIEVQVYCSKRPHLDEFLDWVASCGDMFEVVVYTASQRSYANVVIDCIEQGRHRIKYRLFREHCINLCDNFIKDLHNMGRDLSRMVIVDNSPNAFGYDLDNGIPIEGWFGDTSSSSSDSSAGVEPIQGQTSATDHSSHHHHHHQDTELLKLKSLLKRMAVMSDVRPYIRDKFKMRETVERIVNRFGMQNKNGHGYC